MRGASRASRAGMTLVEMLIGMVVAGVMLGALVGLFIGQSQLMDHQASQRVARDAARNALHVLATDLQRLESSGGVEEATQDSLVIRVPFALGLVCASSSGSTTLSLLPSDSVTYANAAMSGFAWRAPSGAYTYVPETNLSAGTASACSGASISTIAGGAVVDTDAGHASIPAGSPAFLYQRVRYHFEDTADGATLVRTVVESGDQETLVEFFDGSATRFRFFTSASPDPGDTPPADLGDLIGIELALEGLGDRPRASDGAVATAPLNASVFFKNRSP